MKHVKLVEVIYKVNEEKPITEVLPITHNGDRAKESIKRFLLNREVQKRRVISRNTISIDSFSIYIYYCEVRSTTYDSELTPDQSSTLLKILDS